MATGDIPDNSKKAIAASLGIVLSAPMSRAVECIGLRSCAVRVLCTISVTRGGGEEMALHSHMAVKTYLCTSDDERTDDN